MKTFFNSHVHFFRILPDYRNILCNNAIENVAYATWEAVFKLYRETDVPSERTDFLSCLGFTTNPWLLNR